MTAGWGSTPETFPFQCQHCGEPRSLEVILRWQRSPDPDEDFDPEQWTAARCLTCLRPYLFIQELEWIPLVEGFAYGDRQQVHPPTDRVLPMPVPEAIRNDYDEARRCMRARCYTAAAIMARRCVQSICVLHGYPTRTLVQGLKKMLDDKKIDPRLYDWADAVREVGNEGAHDTEKQVSREDAEEVLLFVEALCDYLYVFRARFETFTKRRKAAKEPWRPFDKKPEKPAATAVADEAVPAQS
ncbi:DUF4145 domain-containing protein [Intrasporangium sp. YIM S08009]|uniref:DUF4145 domain-containing protein n=1 Tax=Intrasporangium zincisolvens TaxID=3080018 RepID=UPI002B0575CA|nr:DUF4145 domain-containing protein [Intrasporangium sp. YIM S08009]